MYMWLCWKEFADEEHKLVVLGYFDFMRCIRQNNIY